MTLSNKILSDITVHMKYARYIPEKKRRETWEEIVTRNKEMHIKKYPNLKDEIESAYKFVYDKKVLPSMRSLQFAGKPIEISPNRIYNCFSRDTKFITEYGTKSFEEFYHGDVVKVLTHTGNYKNAIVKNYGKQKLQTIEFHRGRSKKIVNATENHRWILYSGDNTTELKIGDVLYPTQKTTNFDYDSATPMEKLYWCYGYVYGDGTRIKVGSEYRYSMVRLCGDDALKYLYRFEEMQFSTSLANSLSGDVYVYTGKYLKTTPSVEKDGVNMIKAFMDGYLSADAYKNADWYENNELCKYKDIQSSDRDHWEFLEKNLEICGYFILTKKDLIGEVTNYGVHPETYKYSITNFVGSRQNTSWSVASIQEHIEEDVWCLEVDDDHSFVLSGGIVTGNCAYMPVDNWHAFHETMFLLLGGTGVGVSVQKHHVKKLPEIKKVGKQRRYLVGDSIEGWADAVKILFKAYMFGDFLPKYDFSDIRQKGALLVTSGGKAPGPQPLIDCLHNIKKILDTVPVGEKLKPIQVYDIICFIADAVLAGGIRRAALISLFSYDDDDMMSSKFNHWWELNPQRARSNNSALMLRHRVKKEDFFDLWKKIELSKSGEPGIIFSNDKEYGVNPCGEIALRPNQFCVAGDTKLITKDGITNIKDSVGTEIEIWNGISWSTVKPFKTGDSDKLYRVYFSDGSYLDATENHKFLVKNRFEKIFKEVETVNLISLVKNSKYKIQLPHTNISYNNFGVSQRYAYEYGFILGDGFVDGKQIYASLYNEDKKIVFKAEKYNRIYFNWNGNEYEKIKFKDVDFDFSVKLKHEPGLPKEIFSWDRESILQFIAGWADADGSQASKGIRIYGRYDKLYDAQLLLTKLGIYSSLNKMASKGSRTNLSLRKNDVFYLQITITNEIPCQRLICNNSQNAKSKGQYQLISNIVELPGLHESYCLTENTLHQCVFNNVLTKQCNLCEINMGTIESQEDFNERSKAASFIGTLQAGYTDFHYLRDIWKETTEKEALIGIGGTGIACGKILHLNLKESAKIVIEENKRVSKLIGINSAARTTTIKPSGTSSAVLGTSSGIHAWHDKYYIRRLRVGKNEAIYKYLIKKHPELIEDDYFKPHIQAIINIPQEAPDGAIFRNESSIDLLERAKKFNIEWIRAGHLKGANSNNVSVTVSVKDEDWDLVGKWMWENRDTYNGISVIPYDGGTYVQAPFESITKEEYEEMMKSLKEVDITKIIEGTDNTDLQGEIACSGGACSII